MALQTHERQRADIEARLAALSAPPPAIDAAAARAQLRGYLKDWQGLLLGRSGRRSRCCGGW